jgi:hypothetical protein
VHSTISQYYYILTEIETILSMCIRMLYNTHALKTNRPLFRKAGSVPDIVTKHTGRVSTRVRVCKRWLLLVVRFYSCRGMARGNIRTVCIVNGANICHSLTVKLHITRWVWCNILPTYTHILYIKIFLISLFSLFWKNYWWLVQIISVIYTSAKFECSNQLNGCVFPFITFGHSGMSKIKSRHGLALNLFTTNVYTVMIVIVSYM